MSGLVFNGHRFDDLFTYGNPEITILSSEVSYANSGNRNGSVVLGHTWGNSVVSFAIVVEGPANERRNKLSTLGYWLNVDEPKKLYLPDTPDRYYMAIPSGELELTRYVDSETAGVTFTLVDPVAYGETRSVTIPGSSSSSVTVYVNGTYKASPVISDSGAIGGSSNIWGLRLDNADFVHMQFTGNWAHEIEIDNENRSVSIDNDTGVLTLDSDWFELEPGVHTIERDIGSSNGVTTITWQERWL